MCLRPFLVAFGRPYEAVRLADKGRFLIGELDSLPSIPGTDDPSCGSHCFSVIQKFRWKPTLLIFFSLQRWRHVVE